MWVLEFEVEVAGEAMNEDEVARPVILDGVIDGHVTRPRVADARHGHDRKSQAAFTRKQAHGPNQLVDLATPTDLAGGLASRP